MPESAAVLHELPTVAAVEALIVETVHGDPVVREVTFSIARGETVGMVGESGCGKSTVGLALLGHVRRGMRVRSGSVLIGGVDVLSEADAELRSLRGRRVSYVPQNPAAALNPRHRIGDQVAEALEVHGSARRQAQEMTVSLLERVALPSAQSFRRRYPFELSGGQQQRVAIAMALACEPDLVVLDEPTTGLDVTTQSQILRLLSDLAHEGRISFLYVSHDLAVVEQLASRVLVLYGGRLVEAGPMHAVFRNPAHPYTKLLLESVPVVSRRKGLAGIPGRPPSPSARMGGCPFEPRCPVAIPRCRESFPDVSMLTPDHQVACVRPRETSALQAISAQTLMVPQSNDAAVLEVDKISASYRAHGTALPVLEDVTMTVSSGVCVAIVGESGSGKTTLGRCIAGLHIPESGRILLDGDVIAPSVTQRLPQQKAKIQLVFQNADRSLNPRETVEAAIARALQRRGIERKADRLRMVLDLLDSTRLSPKYRRRYPAELSGGEKQRVAIARALALAPRVLICDEITSALDVSTQASVVNLLVELKRDGLSILFITHNIALVGEIADETLVLQSGKVRELGPTASVLESPQHPYTQALMRSTPRLSSHA